MGTVTKVIGSAKGFYDVARYLKKDRESGADRDTGFRMGYNVSPDLMEAAREMAQAAEGRLMREPCLHVVLSLEPAEGKRLSPPELEHMVGDLTREMGWQDYQVLAVEHLDTDHQHVHLMINRAHPLHTGESIDGYYLYNDLRRWAQDFEARREREALDREQATVAGAHQDVAQNVAEATLGDTAQDAGIGQEPETTGKAIRDNAAGDRPPAPREQRQGPEDTAQPPLEGQPRLTDLRALPEKTGLDREILTLVELERLAHEHEIARAMLRADALQRETTGAPLLSDEERHVLRQTAREIGTLLERQPRMAREEVGEIPRNQPVRQGDGVAGPEPGLEAPAPDLHKRIEQRYRELLNEARPYWMHAETAAGDMKDLAMLRGQQEVLRAIKHEPEALGERTAAKMTGADAERVAEAYRRYEAARRQYVAETMRRLHLRGQDAAREPALAGLASGVASGASARGEGMGEAAGSMGPVEAAEQHYVRDVASRMLDKRIEATGEELRKAVAQAERLGTSVRERAYHHLRTALKETYQDPAEAFKRLEAYHARGKAYLVARRPELLGKLHRMGLMQRARGDTPRRRAADLVRRFRTYVEGPEASIRLSSAAEHVEHLSEQMKVLGFAQQRIGTPQEVQQGYEKIRQGLTAGERLRLGIRLEHLPGAEVRRRSEQLIRRALRDYPGAVRPVHVQGLASQKAADRAMGKAAGEMGRKLALRRPLRLAMRAVRVTRAATSKLTMVYQAARTFFER